MNFSLDNLKNNSSLLNDFVNFFYSINLHIYQLEFLMKCLTKKRIAGKWARQTGKSFSVAIYVTTRAILEKTTILLVSPLIILIASTISGGSFPDSVKSVSDAYITYNII